MPEPPRPANTTREDDRDPGGTPTRRGRHPEEAVGGRKAAGCDAAAGAVRLNGSVPAALGPAMAPRRALRRSPRQLWPIGWLRASAAGARCAICVPGLLDRLLRWRRALRGARRRLPPRGPTVDVVGSAARGEGDCTSPWLLLFALAAAQEHTLQVTPFLRSSWAALDLDEDTLLIFGPWDSAGLATVMSISPLMGNVSTWLWRLHLPSTVNQRPDLGTIQQEGDVQEAELGSSLRCRHALPPCSRAAAGGHLETTCGTAGTLESGSDARCMQGEEEPGGSRATLIGSLLDSRQGSMRGSNHAYLIVWQQLGRDCGEGSTGEKEHDRAAPHSTAEMEQAGDEIEDFVLDIYIRRGGAVNGTCESGRAAIWRSSRNASAEEVELLQLLSSNATNTNSWLQRQPLMSTCIISMKVHEGDLVQARALNLTNAIIEAIDCFHCNTPCNSGTDGHLPFAIQALCIEGCLQVIIRLFSGRSRQRPTAQEGGARAVGDAAQPTREDPCEPSPMEGTPQEGDLQGLTREERWHLNHMLNYIFHICRTIPRTLMRGLVQAQVGPLCVTLVDGALKTISRPSTGDTVPKILFVQPPCLPLGLQGTATVDVSLGKWQSSWRLLVIHNGRLAGEFEFIGGLKEECSQEGLEEPRPGAGEGELEQMLQVVVVVRETEHRMERWVNLGQQLPGAVVFVIAGNKGSTTPSTSSSTPLLILSPEAAQEINTLFVKMAREVEESSNSSSSGDAMEHTWNTFFKGMVVDIEYLLVSLPFWSTWVESDSERKAQCHATLEKVSEYLITNQMWETVAFLLKTFIQSSGSICIMGAPLSQDQVTTKILKYVYVMSAQQQRRPTGLARSHVLGYLNQSNGHQGGQPRSIGSIQLMEGSSSTQQSCDAAHSSNGATGERGAESWLPAAGQDRGLSDQNCAASMPSTSGEAPTGRHFLSDFRPLLAARESVFGFQSRSLESSYCRHVNRERAVMDLTMVLGRVVSCALLALQAENGSKHLSQLLTWNFFSPMLLVVLMMWWHAYEDKRERLAFGIRAAKVCSTLTWRVVDWTSGGGAGGGPGKPLPGAGRIIWEVLVFPVWLQVNLKTQLVLGLLEALLLMAHVERVPPWRLQTSAWLQAAMSYCAGCTAVFAVDRLFRRTFLAYRARRNVN